MSEVSLEQILDRKLWPAKPVRLSILRLIAESLDRAHAAGNLHGNLSPRRIFVDLQRTSPTVRVADYGTRFSPDHDLVIGESVPEPARYMSPERILGIDMTPRSDQFSLGLIAYQLVCGRPAFDADTVSPLFYQVCAEPPPNPEDVDHTLSRAVGKVFARVLAKDREQRFSTCLAFVDALALSLEDCEGWAEPEEEPVPQARAMAAAAAGTVTAPIMPVAATTVVENEVPPAPPTADPPVSLPPAFEYPIRQRRRLDAGDFDDETRGSHSRWDRKWILIGALIALVILLAFLLTRNRKPDLPTQVIEPRNAPTSPPPSDARQQPDKPSPPARPSSSPEPSTTARSAPPPPADMAAPGEAETGPSQHTPVEVSTEPAGASITVDGDPGRSCVTPCTVPLGRGRHTLVAQLPGYSTAQRVFQVPGEIPVRITLAKQVGTLLVTSEPSGEIVIVDGKPYGSTPASMQLSPGAHDVTVLNGDRRQTQSVNVQADGIQAKRFTW